MKLFLSSKIHYSVVLGCVALLSMGAGNKNNTLVTETPAFTKLAEGEGSFRAIVHDHQNRYLIKDISFFGNTTVGGVRRESDDSVTRLEISKIKELIVLKSHYDSKHFGDKEFLLAEVKTVNGAVTSDLLMPCKLIICGVDERSGLEKSWFLDKLNRISIQGKEPLPTALVTVLNQAAAQPVKPEPAPVIASIIPEPVKEMLPFAAKQEVAPEPVREVQGSVYEHPQPVTATPDHPQQAKGVVAAFMGIIDSIIDFFRAIIRGVLRLLRF